jgi:hypothetical protein
MARNSRPTAGISRFHRNLGLHVAHTRLKRLQAAWILLESFNGTRGALCREKPRQIADHHLLAAESGEDATRGDFGADRPMAQLQRLGSGQL